MTPEQTFNALQRIAREQGRAAQELLTLYVLERFLARLVESRYADSFVLKGGVLLAGYGLRRPTRDVDMQAIDFVLDEEHCKRVVAELAAGLADDGVVFEAIPTRIDQIRDEEEYSGLRVHVSAQLHRQNLASLTVNFRRAGAETRVDSDVVAETDILLAFHHTRPFLAISRATGWPIPRLRWQHEDCCSERSQGQAFGISG